ncbi:MAG: hypothetical protein KIT10_11370 [Flavobacteriales bacterium]|nr:hypothetical protein [Flavobacteriales bacterium]
MSRAANWISIALHPLFMPLLTLWLAIAVDPHLGYFLDGRMLWITLGMVGVMTIVFPLISTLLLLRGGVIDDLRMPDHRQRVAPFVMTLLYFAMAYWLLRRSSIHLGLLPLLAGAIVALALTAAISLRWRISAHMVGIGGLLGTLSALMVMHALPILPLIAGVILLAGALGTARIVDGGHSHTQIHAGTALGFLCTHLCVQAGFMV